MGETIDRTPGVSDGRYTSTLPKAEVAVDAAQRLTFAINAVCETLKHVRDEAAAEKLLLALADLINARGRLRRARGGS